MSTLNRTDPSCTPCRYFTEDGRPLPQTCRDGDRCRFMHPNNPNWPNSKTKTKSYRSTPLVPQADLFLRSYKDEFSSNERKDRSSSRGPQGMRYRKRSKSPDRGRSPFKKYPVAREKPNATGNRQAEAKQTAGNLHVGGDDPKESPLQRNTSGSTKQVYGSYQNLSSTAGSGSQAKQYHIRKGSPLKRHSENTLLASVLGSDKAMQLFQNLASISRETDQLSEVQRKEESKTETFRKISQTLKSITSAAENAVAPQLARSLLTQEDCKGLIEKNNEACQKIWKDAINIFAEEVTRVVDSHMQDSLLSIRNEAEQAIALVRNMGKRKRWDDPEITEPQTKAKNMNIAHAGELLQGVDDGSSRDVKRQKMGAGCMPTSRALKGLSDAESDQGALIKELKLKIEEQARAIVNLTEENNELRTALRKPEMC
ncbi:hypothetical protein GALMADRAFT_239635 [Galerina marginata CBS 339.88]|uniref:C3H1-type domain-containing protein n=1 Tax=Galerina marginata (strain CBS 339.88) TaxID=685588 RepID=A0A067TEE8_GALM3|nr:hypothetical protein GALMADRAFT_239635 [Galerina marginata CBS 339.88]